MGTCVFPWAGSAISRAAGPSQHPSSGSQRCTIVLSRAGPMSDEQLRNIIWCMGVANFAPLHLNSAL